MSTIMQKIKEIEDEVIIQSSLILHLFSSILDA